LGLFLNRKQPKQFEMWNQSIAIAPDCPGAIALPGLNRSSPACFLYLARRFSSSSKGVDHMQRLLAFGLLCASACGLCAQTIDTTVCDILKNPTAFNGKIVRIKGTVAVGFDQFIVKGPDCSQPVNAIWLSYPEGAKAKARPAAMLQLQPAQNFAGSVETVTRNSVSLEVNKDFKQFDSLLSTPGKAGGMCLGCVRYEVSATLVGRLDGEKAELRRDASGEIVSMSGFGNLNAYSARLVLQSVSDVVPEEIDFSKTPPESGSENTVVQEFGSGIPLEDEPQRAAAAYGKEGEDNGVNAGGMSNEAAAAGETKSDHASPDGVLYNCMFDFDRLKGDQMSRAMALLGEHIADLRSPETGLQSPSIYQLEYRGWVTTMLSAINNGQKSLMLPGGYLIWSSSWSKTDLNSKTQSALKGYLSGEAMLSK
jgi:hypothetical protein